jgi:3-dehydroquinate synthase
MVMAAELSLRTGAIKEKDLARVRSLLGRAGLPTKGPAITPEQMIELMASDKKNAKGKTRFVLLTGIGRAALPAEVDARLVREAIVAAAQ